MVAPLIGGRQGRRPIDNVRAEQGCAVQVFIRREPSAILAYLRINGCWSVHVGHAPHTLPRTLHDHVSLHSLTRSQSASEDPLYISWRRHRVITSVHHSWAPCLVHPTPQKRTRATRARSSATSSQNCGPCAEIAVHSVALKWSYRRASVLTSRRTAARTAGFTGSRFPSPSGLDTCAIREVETLVN